MKVLVALALVAGLAGCVEDPPETGYGLHGTLDVTATTQQKQELSDKAVEFGGRLVIQESFPEQFDASGFNSGGCDSMRAFAESRSYVTDVGSCGPRASAYTGYPGR